ncbi:hypothetical protein [Lentzea flava]|uniref:hypothetical protein n=1 Tax=Lentzea flava TaxID=103732 RepID=UPI001E2D8B03|nr:hypothetical protein [Lentzea flava]
MRKRESLFRTSCPTVGPSARGAPFSFIRIDCAQRAFPQVGRTLAIDENHGTFSHYPVNEYNKIMTSRITVCLGCCCGTSTSTPASTTTGS